MTVVADRGRLACSNHRERGTCPNRHTVLQEHLLTRVFAGLKHRLLAPELVETFVAEYIAEANQANRNAAVQRTQLHGELARVERQITRMVETAQRPEAAGRWSRPCANSNSGKINCGKKSL